eukprot:GCRY01001462.1.p1 GENE.GCRY01001462.1~~GCRY01001462.1.p1  ORF type:complete len:201 (+),score=36.28 GCRY01001462.1:97-699(+)
MMKVTFVTGNANKLLEVKELIKSHDAHIELKNEKVDLPELQGEPEEIAKEKCRIAAKAVNGPVIVEDTCLCFNSLQGLPGPYIKWFLEKLGHEGLNNLLAAYEDKSAYAMCIFSFCVGPGIEPKIFVGKTQGKIVPARGPNYFGWDPVFEPTEGDEDSLGLTYAEMGRDKKHKISHRFKALSQLVQFFKDLKEEAIRNRY